MSWQFLFCCLFIDLPTVQGSGVDWLLIARPHIHGRKCSPLMSSSCGAQLLINKSQLATILVTYRKPLLILALVIKQVPALEVIKWAECNCQSSKG